MISLNRTNRDMPQQRHYPTSATSLAIQGSKPNVSLSTHYSHVYVRTLSHVTLLVAPKATIHRHTLVITRIYVDHTSSVAAFSVYQSPGVQTYRKRQTLCFSIVYPSVVPGKSAVHRMNTMKVVLG